MSKFVKTFFLTMLLVSAAFSENAGFGSIASDRNKPIQFTSDRLIFNQKDNIAELFDGVKITLEKHWKDFMEIFDKKNLSRKECLLLPLRAIAKALKI